MSLESEALKEIDELKSQVSELCKCLRSESTGGIVKDMRNLSGRLEWYDKAKDVLKSTPKQCLNSIKADAISEMIGAMPSNGFNSDREKNNWIGDYIHELRNNK